MKDAIIDGLIDLGAVKFGSFTLKSGLISPVYIDLRMIVGAPELMGRIVKVFRQMTESLPFDLVAGIPYTALPLATIYSYETRIPMVYARKEVKCYGTKRQIEGVFKRGMRVLILDDLITNGLSKFESFSVFESAGLRVTDVAVLIDRKQGGRETLEKAGYRLHALIDIFEILERSLERGRIDKELYQTSRDFILASSKIDA
ncbi:MAG: orotate phosphoribosyltransferase [bacterium]|nr:orotate phosphoribosyltransferase [bacterium]